MSSIDWSTLATSMGLASAHVLEKDWPVVAAYAVQEYASYVEDMAVVARAHEAGTLTDDEATYLVNVGNDSLRAVMLACEGIALLSLEQAINAAINVAMQTIGKAAGLVL